jgi:hypothetical protein
MNRQHFDHGDFEIIVVDDGSTDSTIDVLENYSGRHGVRVLRQTVRGARAARNLGSGSNRRIMPGPLQGERHCAGNIGSAVDTYRSKDGSGEGSPFYVDHSEAAETCVKLDAVPSAAVHLGAEWKFYFDK